MKWFKKPKIHRTNWDPIKELERERRKMFSGDYWYDFSDQKWKPKYWNHPDKYYYDMSTQSWKRRPKYMRYNFGKKKGWF